MKFPDRDCNLRLSGVVPNGVGTPRQEHFALITRTLNKVLLFAGLALAMAPTAQAAESIRKTVLKQEDIDRALALVSCKADRTAFRTLANQMRGIATSGKSSAGWESIAGKGGGYSNALGDMPGVVAEMQLPAPVLVFGHPSRRLILSRSSVVAVFDEALAADLSKALSLDARGGTGHACRDARGAVSTGSPRRWHRSDGTGGPADRGRPDANRRSRVPVLHPVSPGTSCG